MPMGLINAPAKFMHTMNNLFSDMLDSGIAVFLDDILVYSCTVKEHFILFNSRYNQNINLIFCFLMFLFHLNWIYVEKVMIF